MSISQTIVTRNYYLEDGSGNMRFMTSSSGSKSTSANYDPFGNIRSSSGILPDFQFNKQQNDSESNVYFLRARYYDPSIGRFISRDPVKGPLTLPQSQNPYVYALNNPVNLSDPRGLWTIDINASVGSGFAGLTTGILISNTGIYSYGGLGVAQPGPGGGVFFTTDNPTTGLSVSGGAGAIIGVSGSHSYSDNSNSIEVGLTTPGYGAYTIKTNPIFCF